MPFHCLQTRMNGRHSDFSSLRVNEFLNDEVYQVVEEFSWTIGKHSIRLGSEWSYDEYLTRERISFWAR